MLVKTYSLLILVLIISPFNYLSAQWSVGMQGGISISRYELTDKAPDVDLSNKYGLIVGGLVSYDISNKFYLMSGVRYIQKGGQVRINFPSFITDNKLYVNYLEIPVYFNFTPFESDIQPIIYGGPEIGYLLNAKSRGTINGENIEIDYKDHFKKIDIALAIGLGLRYNMRNNLSYLFDINYSYGVKYISEQIRTRGIYISVGVLYDL